MIDTNIHSSRSSHIFEKKREFECYMVMKNISTLLHFLKINIVIDLRYWQLTNTQDDTGDKKIISKYKS